MPTPSTAPATGAMKKLGFIAAILVAGFVMWGFLYPSGSWRHRLTIEVETPEGTKSGSSVVEVRVADVPKLTPEMGASISVRGEAVTVDMGERGSLFALLNKEEYRSYAPYFVYLMFPDGRNNGGHYDTARIQYYTNLYSSGNGTKREVSAGKLPTIVRFRDINNPKTVELVDPNDLVKSFGGGVRFKGATIEMVDAGIWPLTMVNITGEPMTKIIESKLNWLDGYYNLRFDGQRYENFQASNRFANSLSSGAFKSGR